MSRINDEIVAFHGHKRLARGQLEAVAQQAKTRADQTGDRISFYNIRTGRPTDIDLSGDEAAVLDRIQHHPLRIPPSQKKTRGRPKLGVVAKEVTLLPRHWSWLQTQKGGPSATLRRLIDEARKRSEITDECRDAMDAAHAFLWDIGGNLDGFEEASRLLYREEFPALFEVLQSWPEDIQEEVRNFLGPCLRAKQERENAMTEQGLM